MGLPKAKSGRAKGAHQRTLDVEHSHALHTLRLAQGELDDMRQRRDEAERRVRQLSEVPRQDMTSSQLEDMLSLTDEVRRLEMEIERSGAGCDEVDYFLRTGDILFRYYDIIDKGAAAGREPSGQDGSRGGGIMRFFKGGDEADAAPDKDKDKDRDSTVMDDRATLLEKYLMSTDKGFLKASSAATEEAAGGGAGAVMPCAHCGSADRTVMIHDGYIYCNKCFTLEYVLVDHEKPSYKDPPKEVTYFAYKRINHFNEWLNQVQGKETTEIPDEVYDKILLEVKKQKITNMADLTNAKVREILKKLKINKYYEHAPHIINRLSGVSMPHIPPELEDRLRHMFCQIQVPFLKHSPPSRKNFLSYSYVLHKFMQLLEKDQYVKYFTLLKSRDKLQAQDQIWSKICAELGWEFVRSI